MKLCFPWIFTVITLTTNTKYGASDDYGELRAKFSRMCRIMSLKFNCRISCENAFRKFVLSLKGMTTECMMAPKENSSVITTGYYGAYFQATLFQNQPILNNALFWTNTKLVVQRLLATGVNITTYDSIFSTSIIKELRTEKAVTKWCSESDGGIFINSNCQTFQAVYVFWAEAARRFAQNAVGNSFYLTADAAYYPEISLYNEQVLSTLLKRENMCTGITVINIIPRDSKTRCGSGRLSKLEKAVKGTLNYRCFDVYGDHYQPTIELIQRISYLIALLSVGMSS